MTLMILLIALFYTNLSFHRPSASLFIVVLVKPLIPTLLPPLRRDGLLHFPTLILIHILIFDQDQVNNFLPLVF